MLVAYKGKSKCLMTDYNGKRYNFEKNKPLDIPKELYNFIILSEHVDAADLQPILLDKVEPVDEETIPQVGLSRKASAKKRERR